MEFFNIKFALPDPPTSPITSLLPLVFVVSVTAIKQVKIKIAKMAILVAFLLINTKRATKTS